jgi:hypothetical protein
LHTPALYTHKSRESFLCDGAQNFAPVACGYLSPSPSPPLCIGILLPSATHPTVQCTVYSIRLYYCGWQLYKIHPLNSLLNAYTVHIRRNVHRLLYKMRNAQKQW